MNVKHEMQICAMTCVVGEAQAMGGVYSSTVLTKSLGTTASLTNETKHHHFPQFTIVIQPDHAKQCIRREGNNAVPIKTCAHVNVNIESDALELSGVLDDHATDSCRVYTAGSSVPYLVIFIPILKWSSQLPSNSA